MRIPANGIIKGRPPVKIAHMRIASMLALAVAALTPIKAHAADYYAGKQITFIIGTSPGGGYDIYGRTVARHLPRHIPGAPVIIVQNMNGASSIRAAGFIYNIAPKEGTVIGAKARPTRFTIRQSFISSPPPIIPRACAQRLVHRRQRHSPMR